MDPLIAIIAGTFLVVAAFAAPRRPDEKTYTDVRRLPCLPRVRGHRGDYRDAVTEDLRAGALLY